MGKAPKRLQRSARPWARRALLVLVVLGVLAVPSGVLLSRRSPQYVVVLVVDTVRRDALGCYGNARNPTPSIDALAREGVRFEQAVATSGWTLPSVASLLTGTWPTVHGAVRRGERIYTMRRELPTAAEVFREAGFGTFAVANVAYLSPKGGLARGFDVYDYHPGRRRDIRRADRTVDLALSRLAAERHRSSFLLLHIIDPHLDYDPPPGLQYRFTEEGRGPPPPLTLSRIRFWSTGGRQPPGSDPRGERPPPEAIEYIKAIYLAEVAFVDDQIGRFVDGLKRMGLYDRTTLVLTADHGEEFWDHGDFEHGHTLHDELVCVPLIVKPALRLRLSPGVVKSQVRIPDVMPTLFDIAGLRTPATFAGESLLPHLRGEATVDRPALSESRLYGPEIQSWRRDGYTYIREPGRSAGEAQLLRSGDASGEELSRREPETADRMLRELERFRAALLEGAGALRPSIEADLTAQDLQALKSLGYLR